MASPAKSKKKRMYLWGKLEKWFQNNLHQPTRVYLHHSVKSACCGAGFPACTGGDP
jgi:hypothetical protein